MSTATNIDIQADKAAIVLMREDMNRLRGRLFGLIESWGLPERQESACKSLVRQTTYDGQARLESILRGSQQP